IAALLRRPAAPAAPRPRATLSTRTRGGLRTGARLRGPGRSVRTLGGQRLLFAQQPPRAERHHAGEQQADAEHHLRTKRRQRLVSPRESDLAATEERGVDGGASLVAPFTRHAGIDGLAPRLHHREL